MCRGKNGVPFFFLVTPRSLSFLCSPGLYMLLRIYTTLLSHIFISLLLFLVLSFLLLQSLLLIFCNDNVHTAIIHTATSFQGMVEVKVFADHTSVAGMFLHYNSSRSGDARLIWMNGS